MRTPHDTLFWSVLRHPAHAAAWVRSVLPVRIARRIDWRTFASANGRVAGLRLRNHHADLVFCASLLDSEHIVLFVIEHKSNPDGGLHWQVLRYSVHLSHQAQRRDRLDPPFVLPLVLTHGTAPITQTRWARLDLALVTDFVEFQPRIQLIVDDLSRCTEAQLLARELPPLLRLLFLCLQHTNGRSADQLLDTIDRWRDLLREVDRDAGEMTPDDALDALGWYLVRTTEATKEQILMAFSKNLDPQPNEPMTEGQRFRFDYHTMGIAKGEARGEARGEAKGKAQALMRLLQRRFGDLPSACSERLRTADVAQLDLWFERGFDAATLDAVFAAD